MNSRPLVYFALCWVLGSAAGAGLLLSGLMLAGAGLAALLYVQVLRRKSSWLLAAACLAAFAGASAERLWADKHNVTGFPVRTEQTAADSGSGSDSISAYKVEVAGTILSAVEVDGDRAQFIMNVKTAAVAGEGAPRQLDELLLVHIKLAQQKDQAVAAGWKRGSYAVISGELNLPAEATNFGGFDYRNYLLGQRIHWLLKASGLSSVVVSPGARFSKPSLLSHIDDFRNSLGRRMDVLFPAEQTGYMKGLILGMREDLDPEQFRQFSQLGLTHILAVSGLHVAVFLYVLGGLLKLLRMTRERMLLFMITAIPFYVLLTGAAPSIVRAGIMAMLGLFAARLNKLKDGLHLLAAAALLMLIWDPYFLMDVGFQLSFLVTAGLIVGVQPFRRLLPQGKKLKGLFDMIAVTVVAQAVSFPLTIYYFNQIHLLSLLANFILVPFISFIVMPLGGVALVLDALWHGGALGIGSAAAVANRLSFGVVLKLSGMRQFHFIIGTPPLMWVAYMYTAMGVSLSVLYRRGKRTLPDISLQQHGSNRPLHGGEEPAGEAETQPLGLPEYRTGANNKDPATGGSWYKRMPALLYMMLIASLAVPVLWAYDPEWNSRDAYVSFLDVGQGDSILIRTAHGKNILIDGGGAVTFRKKGDEWKERGDPFEVGRKVLVPLLQKRGVQQIDLLVMTHLDSDHIKGLRAVMANIPVKRMLWNGTVKQSEDAVNLLGSAAEQGIPMYRSDGGLSWKIDEGAVIRLLGEQRNDYDHSSVPYLKEQNGHSVAMIVELYNRSFLLTGDADSAEERAILARTASSGSLAAAELQDEGNHSIAQQSVPSSAIDVMKVSHHGSKTSSTAEWLSYWHPSTAVISVGRNNSYGHPNNEVMERITAAGADIKRTDLDGEVEFRITARGELFVRHMLGP
ncbi:ComEC/Rec2 family competence protein [Paenibacillus nasutitermitis]|uniref:Metallo-beta-lactamase domain-containing protein n=1 Tax=Paenibacillus nasutitermitis TaxID=1652958 RepID=A0A917DV79_9BACL|nr:ComEC/Rec2 family competence protein [Paenibacillus nasutitermitis]GGD71744.1 hypothetical protein GCM10010911_32120 [Paenibacillus nasutitermitis]